MQITQILCLLWLERQKMLKCLNTCSYFCPVFWFWEKAYSVQNNGVKFYFSQTI